MAMLRICLLSLLFLPAIAFSQADSLDRFFHYNSKLVIDKFYREHVPLNGWEVTMLPFRIDEQYGFVKNTDGREWIIDPQYQQVYAVYREGAIVKKNKGYGMITPANKTLIPFRYENLTRENGVYHGLSVGVQSRLPVEASVYIENDYYAPDGDFLFSERAHDQRSFMGNDTLAWFRYGSVYHIRNRSGDLVKAFSHNDNHRFVGLCDDILVFADPRGDSLFYTGYDVRDNLQFSFGFTKEDKFEGIYRLSDDLYGLAAGDGIYYFCDAQGVPRLYGVFSGAMGIYYSEPDFFRSEYYSVMDPETRKMGVMTKSGELLLPLEYTYTGKYVNGLCYAVDPQGNEFFFDQAGRKVLDITLLSTTKSQEHSLQIINQPIGFYDELSLGLDYVQLKGASQDGKTRTYTQEDSLYFFWYDQTGTVRLKLSSTIVFAGNFSEGLAPAMNASGGMGFIDTKGNWVIQPKYELAIAGGYPIPYLVVPEFIGGFAYIKAFKGYVDRKGRPLFAGKRMQDEYEFGK